MKRRPAPTNEEIRAAIARAKAGKGRQLALMLKSFSADDLASALSNVGRYGTTMFSIDPWGAIGSALSFASGRKECRDDLNKRLRAAGAKATREWRAKRKAEIKAELAGASR
ncbi:MAG: hypothetical protein WBP38_00395 [Hyphomicrobium sp.]